MSTSNDKVENRSASEDSKDNKKKNFYDLHPEKKREMIACKECGLSYRYGHKSEHYNSQKHKNIITALECERLRLQIKSIQGA